MATDLDPNDALGERLRSLSEPALGQASPDAWAGVQQHRRARRTRHLVAAVGTTVIVLVVAVAAFAATQSGEGGKHVEVVTPSTVAPLPADPPIFDVLPVAKTAQISIANSASPIKAGTEVRIELTQSPHKVGDTINTSMQVCFPYADGETCDPSVDVHWVEGDSRGNTIYRVTMPGWVRTAAGMRSCEVIGCRLAMTADDGTRLGSRVLDVDSGPMPSEPTSLVSAGADGVVRFTQAALEPDESWQRYAAAVGEESLSAGYTGVCALTARVLCDGFITAAEPKFDGKPHTVEVQTNRLLHTPGGWIDCVEVTCAIVLNTSVGVTWNEQSTGSWSQIISIVPYRLPADTPAMKPPTMTVTPTEGLHNKDVVTVMIRDIPPHIPADRVQGLGGIGQCAADDLRMLDDCSFSTGLKYTPLPGNSARVEYPVRTCYRGPKCYIALQAGGNGYPELARTQRFEVLP